MADSSGTDPLQVPASPTPGAELTAPDLIAGFGSGTGEGAPGELPADGGALSQLLSRAAAKTAGSAVEGAFWGAGHLLHEQALGDPRALGEAALQDIGLGTILGGDLRALGGVGGALTTSSKGLITSKLGDKLEDWLTPFAGEGDPKAPGATPSEIRRLGKKLGSENLNDIGRELRENGLLEMFSTPGSVLEKADALKNEADPQLRQLLADADRQSSRSVDQPSWMRILHRSRKEILAPLQKDATPPAAAAEMQAFLDQAMPEELLSDSPVQVPRTALHDLRQQIDRSARDWQENPDPHARPMGSALSDLRDIVSDELNGSVESSLRGEGLTQWNALHRKYQVASVAQELAARGLQRVPGDHLLAGATPGDSTGVSAYLAEAFRRALSSGEAPEAVQALSAVEAAHRRLSDRLEEGATKLFQPARSDAPAASRGSEDSAMDRFDRQVRALDSVDVPHLVTDELGGLSEHAPETSQALQVTAARALAFLQSKIPRSDPRIPGAQPSRSQLATFHRSYEAVADPARLLQHAADGTLTPEEVEAVATVYPQTWGRMQTAVLKELAAHQGVVPSRNRATVAAIVGQDSDRSIAGIARNQPGSPYLPASGPSKTGVPTRGHAAAKALTLPERLLTAQQGEPSATPG